MLLLVRLFLFGFLQQKFLVCSKPYRTHQGVEYTDSKGCAAGEGLSEVQLRVWIIVIILVQELNIWVIH